MNSQVIYKIRNVTNQKFYVGSTTNKRERFRNHRRLLRKGIHHCKHLQAAWAKYSEECFIFEVVEEVPDGGDLWAAENRWLEEHFGKPYCYNAGRSADAPMRGRVGALHPNFGISPTAEVKQAISETLKVRFAAHPETHPQLGRTRSDETKEILRQAKRVNPTRAWLGKERSDETKAKISAAQKGVPKAPGRTVTEAGREKIRANIEAGRSHKHWTGRTHTEESKAKMGVAVVATLPDGTTKEFATMSALCEAVGVFMPTIIRACQSGRPISMGVLSGWTIAYKGRESAVVAVPPEYAHLPRTRQLATEQGAPLYFTGLACSQGHVVPRKVKGMCVECYKIAGQKSNERARAKKLAKSDPS
jgi:group I intron endonuclease